MIVLSFVSFVLVLNSHFDIFRTLGLTLFKFLIRFKQQANTALTGQKSNFPQFYSHFIPLSKLLVVLLTQWFPSTLWVKGVVGLWACTHMCSAAIVSSPLSFPASNSTILGLGRVFFSHHSAELFHSLLHTEHTTSVLPPTSHI